MTWPGSLKHAVIITCLPPSPIAGEAFTCHGAWSRPAVLVWRAFGGTPYSGMGPDFVTSFPEEGKWLITATGCRLGECERGTVSIDVRSVSGAESGENGPAQ